MNDVGSQTSRSTKLKKLEKAWNPNMNTSQESRRLAQMTEDIKHFIVRSMSDPMENRRFAENYQRERQQNSTNTFSTIANTLGFKHHDGTDQSMELRVIKVIMIREGILMSLKYAAELAERQGNLKGNNLLELMSQLRESTLNYLEYLCLWRQSSQSDSGQTQPRAFMWENQNYTMKLISDIDFLSDNSAVIECLNLTQEQLRSNPLMLSNNLEDFNTWMAPEERAAVDVQGNTNSSEFQTRLRLRYAERILLQEMELYNFEGSQIFMTQDNINNNPNSSEEMMMLMNSQPQNVMVGSNALENEYEYDPNQNVDNNAEFAAMMGQAPADSGLQNSVYSPERRVRTTEGSNRTSDFSQPQSRASTITNGFLSAPATSYGSRDRFGDTHSGMPINGAGGMPLDYGHDFFTGNWGDGASSDAFPFFSEGSLPPEETSQYPPPNQNQSKSNRIGFEEDEEGDEEVLYRENVQVQSFESYTPMNDVYNHGIAHIGSGNEEDNESLGQNSVRSIESISEVDMRVLAGLFVPPKVVNLAGAVSVVLLSKGNEIPLDASWPAYLRLMKRPGFAESMNTLLPSRVPRFKLLAIQPMLDQIFYDERANHEEYSRKQMSFQELIAVTKLMNWVRQFSESESKAMRDSTEHGGSLKDSKNNKKKSLISPFKSPSVALRPLNANSAIPSDESHKSKSKKAPTSPIKLTAGEQNQTSKERIKASRVKEKTMLVQLARKQMEDKEKKKIGDTKKKVTLQVDNTQSSSTSRISGSVKSRKQSIPKVQLDLVPFHEETLDNVYVNPVVVALLTSPDALDIVSPRSEGSNNNDEEDTYSEDENEDDDAKQEKKQDKKNRIKYVIPPIPKTTIEQTRLVVKIHESTESKESTTFINMREFQLFLEDLPEKLSVSQEEVHMFFRPFDLRWWAEHIAKVIAVNVSGGAGNKSLKVSISKQKIEEYVRMQVVNLHRLPIVGGKRQTFSTPRRSILGAGSVNNSAPSSAKTNMSTKPSSAQPPIKEESAKAVAGPTSTKTEAASTQEEKKMVAESPKSPQMQQSPSPLLEEGVKEAEASAEEEHYQEDADFAQQPATIAPEESIGYGDDFEDAVVKPTTSPVATTVVETSPAAGEEEVVEEVVEEVPVIPAVVHVDAPGSAVGSDMDSQIAMGSLVIDESHAHDHTYSASPCIPQVVDEGSAEETFPELKVPSRITSTRTSIDVDALQRQISSINSHNNNSSSNIADGENVQDMKSPSRNGSTRNSVDVDAARKQVSSALPDNAGDNSSIEDNFPDLKPPSRITSTRTSVEFDVQRQASNVNQPTATHDPVNVNSDGSEGPAANDPVNVPPEGSAVAEVAGESMYGSDFEQAEGSVILQQASPFKAPLPTNANEEADNSLIFEVSANSVPMRPVDGDEAVVPMTEVEDDEDDDGIYDDDLSEAAQAPIDRSMSMSASMRMSSSFVNGSSNPPSSVKAPVQQTVLEPEEDDDSSLYNIPDDD